MGLIGRSIALVMLLALGGCITDQLTPSTSAGAQGQATISISRSDDLTYGPAVASVELNGKQIATLAMGRTYTDSLSPGPAVLKVSAWTPSLGFANHRLPAGSTSYRFNVEAGKSYSFVISPRAEPVAQNATGSVGGTGETTEGGGGPFLIAAGQ
jgi:hypothetical protein